MKCVGGPVASIDNIVILVSVVVAPLLRNLVLIPIIAWLWGLHIELRIGLRFNMMLVVIRHGVKRHWDGSIGPVWRRTVHLWI